MTEASWDVPEAKGALYDLVDEVRELSERVEQLYEKRERLADEYDWLFGNVMVEKEKNIALIRLLNGVSDGEDRGAEATEDSAKNGSDGSARLKAALTEAGGEPDESRAVNQLQELWQKGFIDEPTYTEDEQVTDVSVWNVVCSLKSGLSGIGVASGKKAAKKLAAYNLYKALLEN